MNFSSKCVTFFLFMLRHLDIIYSIRDLQRDILIRINLHDSDVRILCAIMISKLYQSRNVMLPFGPKTDYNIYLQKKFRRRKYCNNV